MLICKFVQGVDLTGEFPIQAGIDDGTGWGRLDDIEQTSNSHGSSCYHAPSNCQYIPSPIRKLGMSQMPLSRKAPNVFKLLTCVC